MIVLYVLSTCPYCNSALQLLKENKIKHKAIYVENEQEKELYKKQNGMNTFPQIFMQVDRDNYMKVGGCDDLIEIVNVCKSIRGSNVSLDSIYYMYQNIYSK